MASAASGDGSPTARELPVIQPAGPVERADAARNRRRILDAAARLFAEHGGADVSMDDVAACAGVGKGTLYRRFGDKSGLALALLDEADREFQEALIRGEPPLGPGAPPRERLHAFGDGYLRLLEEHGDLMLLGTLSKSAARAAPPAAFHRTHLTLLLGEAAPDADAELGAELLLSALSPVTYAFLREQGFSVSRLREGWRMLVDGWLAAATARTGLREPLAGGDPD
jgi:AcrR family transcriptional regulator